MIKESHFRAVTFLAVILVFVQCTTKGLADWQLYSTVSIGGGSTSTNTLVIVNPQSGEMVHQGTQGGTPHQESIDVDPVSGFLFGINEYTKPGVFTIIDPGTGQWTETAAIQQDENPVALTSLSFSPNGTLYAISDYKILGVINLGMSSFTTIAELDIIGEVYGMDFSPQGVLYFVESYGIEDTYQQWLLTANASTGEIISTLPTGEYNAGDIDFAPDGYIYHTNFSWYLFKIDPATAEQTEVGNGGLGPFGGIVSIPEQSADLNGDGKVDFEDFAIFADQWLLAKLSADVAQDGGDGIVNFVDWAVFANGWDSDMNELANFVSQWLKSGAYSGDIAPSPAGDGIVNLLDFEFFALHWLEGAQ
jgi:hypothetical protein